MPEFLTKDYWRTVNEFEVILRDTSRLTLVCQNEDKLKWEHRPVMRKSIHDSLSRATMPLINTEQWISDKHMMHPTRLEANVDFFTETGKYSKR